jgi:hypothetical protein
MPFQILLFIAWPPPMDGTVGDWFLTFQESPIHGLLSLDLVMMVEQVLLIPVVLALWVLLHRRAESTMAIAVAFSLVASTLFIASNTGFEMLSLSRGYAAATTDAAREPFLAAGQAALASYWDQGTAFIFGYVLASTAGVMVGFAMLQSAVFHRFAAYAAIVANAAGLAIFVPEVGIALAILSVLILWVWYVLVGLRLVRPGRDRTVLAATAAAAASAG